MTERHGVSMDNWNRDQTNKSNGQNEAQPQAPRRQSGFLAACLIFSILALCTVCTGVLPLVFGSLSILFAVLSKRRSSRPEPMGIIGIVLSAVGSAFGLFLIIVSFYMVYSPNSPMPEAHEEMNAIMERIYGMDADEYLKQFYLK